MCRGALVFKRLLDTGRPTSPVKPGTKPDPGTVELIVKKMCIVCDFHEHDCDFMEDRKAPPCGGFVLLSLLVTSGQIDLDELT